MAGTLVGARPRRPRDPACDGDQAVCISVPPRGSSSPGVAEMVVITDSIRLAFCFTGVVGALLIYGVLQERIMTLPFGEGDNQEVFKYSLFIVSCNRLIAACIAACTLVSKGMYSELKPVAPIYAYASVSLSNVIATTCQYEALKHVSFAVQTLGKCAKMFPVMVWGFFILKKRYGLKDVGLAVAITGGCFVFFSFGPTASRVAKGAASNLFGVGLMGGYLFADGYTSTFQQAMFKGHSMSTYNQVLWTALCSIVLSSFGLISSGQVGGTIRFLIAHPEAAFSIFLLSTAASCGSLFISYTIKTFGALTFAVIMTTRQFLSILLSSFFFGNPLTGGQWLGTLIVVTSLYYQGLTKEAKSSKTKEAGGEGEGADPLLSKMAAPPKA
ncbi:drug metabolite transporter [Raphidocelis subcapitata]|uniref:Drug metabolite transporter n=1 Tax=Raphidocelis subcapitata TaxID=307507 RepID=A0A2V0PCK3_9CHLO|nr:drug metabolite transporter [Raphidocelis subcapitata]|eukprot:GBF97259.1 drug metabolite transporter [Raphidocelis subcapitata]